MLILVLFSFLAGIVTVASPCVLPVLPALLAAGYDGGKSRAWGVILGFLLCFTIATITLRQALYSVGADGLWLRYAAIGGLAFFGLTMLIPPLGEKFAQWTSPLSNWGSRLAPKRTPGFFGGFILGLALGLLWTPCAGPILATIIILTTLQALDITSFAMTLAYGLGAALPMLLIMYFGSAIQTSTAGNRRLSTILRSTFGVLTILVAVGLAFNWQEAFQQKALEYLPVIEVENNRLVKKRLETLVQSNAGKNITLRVEDMKENKMGTLPNLGAAPEFTGITEWINVEHPPLKMSELKGKVVLIDFWTYSCINCIRTLPYLKRWYSNYKDRGLVVVGVHTPEFAFEKEIDNVRAAVKRHGITYPVGLDNEYSTWKAYGNLYWPAHYLIDQEGNIRYFHFGEGKYIETENAIRQLLGMPPMNGLEEIGRRRALTPETYLGYKRAQGYPLDQEIRRDKEHTYKIKELPTADQVELEGPWIVYDERIESASDESYLYLNFIGTRVYLVLSGASTQPVKVTLDDKAVPAKYFSSDMHSNDEIIVREARKYDMINLGKDYGRHMLKIRIPKGISAYAFTFGDE